MSDVMRSLATAISHPDYFKTKATIWDMRAGDFNVSAQELENSVPAIEGVTALPSNGRRVAWVVEFQAEAEIMEAIYRDHPWTSKWRMFTSIRQAEEWVSEP